MAAGGKSVANDDGDGKIVATLVFEIGTEEMPAGAAKSGVVQLGSQADSLLEELRLKTPESDAIVRTYGTPRRLVLIIENLAEKQTSAVDHIKGPPKQAAFADDGQPKPAAIGFASSSGVGLDQLETRETEGREYVYAVKEQPGEKAEEVLPGFLASLVDRLEFTKAMRWGSGGLRFIRPIRWLLALYGNKVVPFELDGVTAGRLTYGHRFLAEGPFELAEADDYLETMAQAKVIVGSDKERELSIKEMIEDKAAATGGLAAINQQVLGEVVYLVEDPHVVVGEFDKDFLKIPRAVLTTAMESHQRYFPIEDKKGKLLPFFAVVHNGDPAFDDKIRLGHERVLRARLADAAFFFAEDTKTTLASKVDLLKKVVWQKKAGTVYDKVIRSVRLGESIANSIGLNKTEIKKVRRAIELAKADLTTSMVIEFPDLQGAVGGEYALVDGEDKEIAAAISEHYRPRFAGDGIPGTTIGCVAALADKIDTITGCFLVGLIPTGSADPYSLRRQAAGIVRILAETKWQIGIMELIKLAIDNYTEAGISSSDTDNIVVDQIQEFIVARLRRMFVDGGAELETIEAVLAAGFDRVSQISNRVSLIDSFKGKNELEDTKLAFTRCENLSKSELGDGVKDALFETDEERKLLQACRRAKKEMEKTVADDGMEPAIHILASMREPIDNFFEEVLVMAPDEKIRSNRLRLLNLCVGVSRQVADFSKLK